MNSHIDWNSINIIIINNFNNKYFIKLWQESCKCNAFYTDYNFISYNVIKKLIKRWRQKHVLFVFIIYIYKITDDLDKRYDISSNKTFSISSSSITNTKTTKII